MSEILLGGFWQDLPVSLPRVYEEINRIDRVITKRLALATAIKKTSGFMPNQAIDDLLGRRQTLSDLAYCLHQWATFESDDRATLMGLTYRVSKAYKSPRFPG